MNSKFNVLPLYWRECFYHINYRERFEVENKSESGDEIPVIPDLDDIQDEPSSPQEIKAPMYVFHAITIIFIFKCVT